MRTKKNPADVAGLWKRTDKVEPNRKKKGTTPAALKTLGVFKKSTSNQRLGVVVTGEYHCVGRGKGCNH